MKKKKEEANTLEASFLFGLFGFLLRQSHYVALAGWNQFRLEHPEICLLLPEIEGTHYQDSTEIASLQEGFLNHLLSLQQPKHPYILSIDGFVPLYYIYCQ